MIESMMERTVNRNLLKYACGRAMFCGCGAVLDYRRAVLISIGEREIIACGKCFDQAAAKLPQGASVIDGRAK